LLGRRRFADRKAKEAIGWEGGSMKYLPFPDWWAGAQLSYISGETWKGPGPDYRQPELFAGDRQLFEAAVAASKHKHPVHYGCLSFKEGELKYPHLRKKYQQLMKALATGIPRADRIDIGYLHRERGLEGKIRWCIHFGLLRTNLRTTKTYEPGYYLADARRMLAWQEWQNLADGLTSPLNPERARTTNLSARRLPVKARTIKEGIDLYLAEARIVDPAVVQSEEALRKLLMKYPNAEIKEVKFKTAWTGRRFVVLDCPDNKNKHGKSTNLRMEGTHYDQWRTGKASKSLATLIDEIRRDVLGLDGRMGESNAGKDEKGAAARFGLEGEGSTRPVPVPSALQRIRAIFKRENRTRFISNRRRHGVPDRIPLEEIHPRRDGRSYPSIDILGDLDRLSTSAAGAAASYHAGSPNADLRRGSTDRLHTARRSVGGNTDPGKIGLTHPAFDPVSGNLAVAYDLCIANSAAEELIRVSIKMRDARAEVER
jgi:hypothetical protein